MGRARALVIATVLVATVLSACGDDDRTPPPAYALELQPAIVAMMQEMSVPGAVVLVRSRAKGDWSATFGSRTIDGVKPLTMDDHFRIGSNTKTMTNTVVLQLVQEGKLVLEDPVSKYRPDVPNGQNITIGELLDMRSGLYSYTADEGFNARLDTDPGHAWQPAELLEIAFMHPPNFSPGTEFEYSNTNTVLLGLIVEQLTGQPLEETFRERIYEPLKLHDTLLPALDDADIPAPHPQGYMFGTNVSTLADPALPASEQAAAAAGTLRPNDVTDDNPSWAWAAGGVISTAGDLARYVEALVDGGLLGPVLQQVRLASIQSTDPSNPSAAGYGLGIAKFGPMIGHDGQLPGFNSFMGRDPYEHNTVIVFTSLLAGPDGRQPANELARAILAALYA